MRQLSHQKHKLHEQEYNRRFRLENPEKARERDRRLSQTFNGRYNHYKKGAKRKHGRAIAFELTKEEFATMWQKPCFYCGSPIKTIGIDRIDSNQGYFLKNCVSCCSTCNLMKLDNTAEEWLTHIRAILAFQEKKAKIAT